MVISFNVDGMSFCGFKELCLQTKLLAPSTCQVAEFLSKAPQPPPVHAIKNAVHILKVTSTNIICSLYYGPLKSQLLKKSLYVCTLPRSGQPVTSEKCL